MQDCSSYHGVLWQTFHFRSLRLGTFWSIRGLDGCALVGLVNYPSVHLEALLDVVLVGAYQN